MHNYTCDGPLLQKEALVNSWFAALGLLGRMCKGRQIALSLKNIQLKTVSVMPGPFAPTRRCLWVLGIHPSLGWATSANCRGSTKRMRVRGPPKGGP